jgi:hypothetical protein
MTTGSGGGLLTIVLSLLTSHLVSLDITAHNDALKLAGKEKSLTWFLYNYPQSKHISLHYKQNK